MLTGANESVSAAPCGSGGRGSGSGGWWLVVTSWRGNSRGGAPTQNTVGVWRLYLDEYNL